MFTAARAELGSLTLEGLTRSGLEFVFEEITALESAVAERRLAVLAALEGLGDGGLDRRSMAGRTRSHI